MRRKGKSSLTRSIISFLLFVLSVFLFGDLYFVFHLRRHSAVHSASASIDRVVSGEQNLASQERQKQDDADARLHNRTVVAQILREAGAHVPDEAKLPTLAQIAELYGPRPIILGLDQCQAFRDRVPATERMLGAAGMFSTGTNLVTHLLKKNCYIPERAELHKSEEKVSKEKLGMRWQVPWGKHTPASFKHEHATEKAQSINKEYILPIVSIRNPWRWMQSMCKNPYSAKWPHFKLCPHLTLGGANPNDWEWNPVSIKYGAGTETYQSLVHLWIEWYRQYAQLVLKEASNNHDERDSYPVLIVRMEDLTFYAKETITQVCHCAGGEIWSNQPFQYVIDSAKNDSPGHDTSVGLTEAWIKYSQPLKPMAGFVDVDHAAALHALEHDDGLELMKTFGYGHPATS